MSRHSSHLLLLTGWLIFFQSLCQVSSFTSFIVGRKPQPPQPPTNVELEIGNTHLLGRRECILQTITFAGTVLFAPKHVFAAPTKASATEDPVATLIAARQTLQKLLDNWEKAVIDCTFADVPRELLEQKNKEELLEKASTFALFDKSVSVETCKTTNRIVRDYLGATGIGPLVGLEKQMKKALDHVNPDFLDEYVTEIELIDQTLAKARSLSYTAGVADFNSVNNFEKDQVQRVLAGDSNLEQTRLAIEQIIWMPLASYGGPHSTQIHRLNYAISRL
eukprot:scaffold1581_cov169-Amphora_coffeaeformis.AAC.35